MDPNILFDESTPFDEVKLNLLDNIVNTFYTTKNNQEVKYELTQRDLANKILSQYKQLPSNWTHCDLIFNKSQSIYTKIIGLGLMEDVIQTRWNLLSDEQRLSIRNFLVDLLIKSVNDDNTFNTQSHFINKLNIVIVQVFLL
jgi:exportin-1